jgi:hypothetical protein
MMIVKRISNFLFMSVVSLALPATAYAENWQPVTGDALRSVFSDTVQTAELGGGSKAVAQYNADGSGELVAWGDTFARSWKLDGGDLVCILIDNKNQCWRVEQNADKPDEYRGTKLSTDESVIFTVSKQQADIEAPPKTQEGSAAQPSAAEMAQKLANPTNPIMTIGNNVDLVTFKGDLPDAEEQSSVRYLFQTSFPFKLSDGKGTVFIRPAIPIFFNEPVPVGPGEYDSKGVELGDIGFDFSYGNTTKTGWIYGGGMVGTLPTATDDALGKDKWAFGPEALFGKIGKWGAALGLVTHQWDVGGSGEAKINATSLTYVYAFAVGGGWQISAAPVITYDHEALSGDELNLPLGIGIAKTSIIKGRPWKFQVQYWNYVEGNDAFGPEHLVRFSVSPVISAPWNAGK